MSLSNTLATRRALAPDPEPAAVADWFGDGRGSLPIGGGRNRGRLGFP